MEVDAAVQVATPALSIAEKVPAEIWLEILALVSKSTDLYSLSVSSRRFHDLTTRALHRNLVWLIQRYAEQNLAVWEREDGMETHVRSLELSLPSTTFHHVSGTDNRLHDRSTAARIAASNASRGNHTTTELPNDAVWERVHKFTNISSLAFVKMDIEVEQFRLIHALPHLRSLRLEVCVLHGNAAQEFDNRTLPITELTMLDIRRGPDLHPPQPINLAHVQPINFVHLQQLQQLHWPGPIAGGVHANLGPGVGAAMWIHPPDPFAQALSLAVAQNLHTLTVDASADVFRHVFAPPDAQARGWTVPTTMENLYVHRKRTLTTGEHKPSAGWAVPQGTFPDTHLYHYCTQAPNLKVVSTPIFVPAQVTVAPEALPLSIDRFAGPLETAQFVAAVRDVQALGLFRCGLSSREGITALTSIARVRPRLKMLMMESKGWDMEIVTAVSRHFKELRRLKIVYDGQGPDEVRPHLCRRAVLTPHTCTVLQNFLVSLAPDFLVEMPELHTLEMYQLPPCGGFVPEHPPFLCDPSWGSIEEEMRDILIGWNRFCPKLRKVQLVSGYRMARGFEGGVWKLEKIRRLEQVEYLDF